MHQRAPNPPIDRGAGASSVSLPFDDAAHALATTGRWMASRGLVPATSGNLSCRLGPERVAITASGGDKGALEPEDILDVAIAGPIPARASAEVALHLALYRDRPDVGAVLHGHSLVATLVSAGAAEAGRVALPGYELVKAFRGVRTHEHAVDVPVFDNSQDMQSLAERVSAGIASSRAPCYLLAGHGFYAWGATLGEARRHVEALEFLLACVWERAKVSP